MRLTQENAHLYEGQKLDGHRNRFHYYPLEVRKSKVNDEYMVIDRNGVCMHIAPEKDFFNRIDFDFVALPE